MFTRYGAHPLFGEGVHSQNIVVWDRMRYLEKH